MSPSRPLRSSLRAALRGDTPPPVPLTAAEVRARHDGLGPLLSQLPALSLSPAQRMALSGRCLLSAPSLVLAVIGGLRRAPELFVAEAPLAEALEARLERAVALRSLERLLLGAARRAGDLALCDEAAAAEDATAVLQRARDGAQEPGGRRRLDALRGALRILEDRAEAARRGRRRQLRDG